LPEEKVWVAVGMVGVGTRICADNADRALTDKQQKI
jgi:hypothetical protein